MVLDSLGQIIWNTESPITGDELLRILVVEHRFHQRDVFERMSFAMGQSTIDNELMLKAKSVVSDASNSVSEDPKLGRAVDLLRKWIRLKP